MKIEINTLEYKEYNTVNIMTEPVYSSSSSSSSSSSPGMTIDIRPMVEDVAQVMTKHITTILTGVIGEYTIYKETHDTIMGLPCVRKLQDRINQLECGSDRPPNHTASRAENTEPNSREDEVAQLQSAIVELNRYIIALESKVDMKAVCSSKQGNDEESIRLEIYEDESEDETMAAESFVVPTSTHKNVIISVPAEEEEEEAESEDVEADAEAEEAEEAEDAEAEAEAEEAEAEESEAEEADAEAEEAEDAEADAEAEEAEIEVSEVKIKGKMYFTTDAQNGIIYACVDDDVGDEVGVFKNGVAVFNKSKK